MSLLNDVLKDLDQRDASQRRERTIPQNLQTVSPSQVRRGAMMASALILLALTLVLLLAWFGWRLFVEYRATDTNVFAENQLLVQAIANQVPAPELNEKSTDSGQPLANKDNVAKGLTDESTALPEGNALTSDSINAQMSVKHEVREDDHSVTPELLDNQEHSQEQAVSQAQSGSKIQAKQLQTTSQDSSAEQHRGSALQDGAPVITEQADYYGSLVKVMNPGRTPAASEESTHEQSRPVKSVLESGVVQQQEPFSYRQQTAGNTGDPDLPHNEANRVSAINEASIQLSRDPQAVANRKLNKAKKIYREGNPRYAEQMLREALAVNGGHGPSRLQLGSWLMARGAWQDVLVLLNQVDDDSPPDLRALKAHALFVSDQPQQALALLQTNLPPVDEYSQFHSLRAGLLQQSGQYGEALMVYAELVEVDAGQGAWWAGLGISLEQTGRLTSAARAYYQALTDKNLGEQLAHYAEQRLINLSANPSN